MLGNSAKVRETAQSQEKSGKNPRICVVGKM